jgi:hypothetical protein
MADAYGPGFSRISIQYQPTQKQSAVGLSFHLTEVDKKDLAAAVTSETNQQEFAKLLEWLKKQ